MQAARGASLSPEPGQVRTSGAAVGLFGIAAVSVWALDQLTKVAAVAWLDDKTVTLIPHVFGLTLTRNAGAAFSTGTGFTLVLSIIAVAVVITVLRLATKLRDRWWGLGLGLLLGGALGNLTDRILREPAPLRGHVVDFLHINHWPVFNVADVALTFAAITIILRTWRGVSLDGSRGE
jgi:signal peptidase II